MAKLQNDENESNVQAHHDQNQDTALILAHNRIDEKRIALSVGVYFGAEFVSITEPFLFFILKRNMGKPWIKLKSGWKMK